MASKTRVFGDAGHTATVVWLHGLGDTPSGWLPACREMHAKLKAKGHNIKFVLPEAPVQPVSCNGGYAMTSWMDLEDIPIAPDTPDNGKGFPASLAIVKGIVDTEVGAGIPRSRIIVGGFSQGGALALAAVLKSDEPVAAACCLSSWAAPSQDLPAAAAKLAAAPHPSKFLVCHGTSDGTVVTECGKQAHAMLADAGLVAELKLYPGMAHGSCAQEITDVVTFIGSVLA